MATLETVGSGERVEGVLSDCDVSPSLYNSPASSSSYSASSSSASTNSSGALSITNEKSAGFGKPMLFMTKTLERTIGDYVDSELHDLVDIDHAERTVRSAVHRATDRGLANPEHFSATSGTARFGQRFSDDAGKTASPKSSGPTDVHDKDWQLHGEILHRGRGVTPKSLHQMAGSHPLVRARLQTQQSSTLEDAADARFGASGSTAADGFSRWRLTRDTAPPTSTGEAGQMSVGLEMKAGERLAVRRDRTAPVAKQHHGAFAHHPAARSAEVQFTSHTHDAEGWGAIGHEIAMTIGEAMYDAALHRAVRGAYDMDLFARPGDRGDAPTASATERQTATLAGSSKKTSPSAAASDGASGSTGSAPVGGGIEEHESAYHERTRQARIAHAKTMARRSEERCYEDLEGLHGELVSGASGPGSSTFDDAAGASLSRSWASYIGSMMAHAEAVGDLTAVRIASKFDADAARTKRQQAEALERWAPAVDTFSDRAAQTKRRSERAAVELAHHLNRNFTHRPELLDADIALSIAERAANEQEALDALRVQHGVDHVGASIFKRGVRWVRKQGRRAVGAVKRTIKRSRGKAVIGTFVRINPLVDRVYWGSSLKAIQPDMKLSEYRKRVVSYIELVLRPRYQGAPIYKTGAMEETGNPEREDDYDREIDQSMGIGVPQSSGELKLAFEGGSDGYVSPVLFLSESKGRARLPGTGARGERMPGTGKGPELKRTTYGLMYEWNMDTSASAIPLIGVAGVPMDVEAVIWQHSPEQYKASAEEGTSPVVTEYEEFFGRLTLKRVDPSTLSKWTAAAVGKIKRPNKELREALKGKVEYALYDDNSNDTLRLQFEEDPDATRFGLEPSGRGLAGDLGVRAGTAEGRRASRRAYRLTRIRYFESFMKPPRDYN